VHFVATISSKGQITLPARLRDKLKLEEGDKVEFYVDHKGRVMMRPRKRSAQGFLDSLPPRKPDPDLESEDAAIAKAVEERDAKSRRREARAR